MAQSSRGYNTDPEDDRADALPLDTEDRASANLKSPDFQLPAAPAEPAAPTQMASALHGFVPSAPAAPYQPVAVEAGALEHGTEPAESYQDATSSPDATAPEPAVQAPRLRGIEDPGVNEALAQVGQPPEQMRPPRRGMEDAWLQEHDRQQRAGAQQQAGIHAYLKSKGVQTETLPDGSQSIATHEDGAPRWKPASSTPFQDPTSGQWLVRQRDERGQLHDVSAHDFHGLVHTDQHTGDQFFIDPATKRAVKIGTDTTVVQSNAVHEARSQLYARENEASFRVAQLHEALKPIDENIRQIQASAATESDAMGGKSKTVKQLENERDSLRLAVESGTADDTVKERYKADMEALSKVDQDHPEYATFRDTKAATMAEIDRLKGERLNDYHTRIQMVLHPGTSAAVQSSLPDTAASQGQQMPPGAADPAQVARDTAVIAGQQKTTQAKALPLALQRMKAAGLQFVGQGENAVPIDQAISNSQKPSPVKAPEAPAAPPKDSPSVWRNFIGQAINGQQQAIGGLFETGSRALGATDAANAFKQQRLWKKELDTGGYSPDNPYRPGGPKAGMTMGAPLLLDAGADYVDPKQRESVMTGLAHAAPDLAALWAGGNAMLPSMMIQGAAEGATAAEDARDAGQGTESDAMGALKGAAKTGITLALFGGSGKLAKGLMPAIERPAMRALAAAGITLPVNAAVDVATNKLFGGNAIPQTPAEWAQRLAFAIFFSGHAGYHEAKVPGQITEAIKVKTDAERIQLASAQREIANAVEPLVEGQGDAETLAKVADMRASAEAFLKTQDPRLVKALDAKVKAAADLAKSAQDSAPVDPTDAATAAARAFSDKLKMADILKPKVEGLPTDHPIEDRVRLSDQLGETQNALNEAHKTAVEAVPEVARKAIAATIGGKAEAIASHFEEQPDAAFQAAHVGRELRELYTTPEQQSRVEGIAARVGEHGPAAKFVADQYAGMKAARDLTAIAALREVPPERVAGLQRMGLVEMENGHPMVTHDALPLLPKGLVAHLVTAHDAYRVKSLPGEKLQGAAAMVRAGQGQLEQVLHAKALATRPAAEMATHKVRVQFTNKAGKSGETTFDVGATSEEDALAKAMARVESKGTVKAQHAEITTDAKEKARRLESTRGTSRHDPLAQNRATPAKLSDFTPAEQQFANLLGNEYRRNQKYLEALGISKVELVRNSADKSGLAVAPGGRLQLDASQLKKQADTFSRQGVKAKEWARAALQEEVWHAIQFKAAGADFQSHYADLHSALSPEMLAHAREVYTDFDSLPKHAQAAEVERMILQQKWNGTITEKFIASIEKILAYLRGLKIESPLLKESIARVEAVREEALRRAENESPSPPGESDTRTSPESPLPPERSRTERQEPRPISDEQTQQQRESSPEPAAPAPEAQAAREESEASKWVREGRQAQDEESRKERARPSAEQRPGVWMYDRAKEIALRDGLSPQEALGDNREMLKRGAVALARSAIAKQQPFHAEFTEEPFGLAIPDGYEKQGDRYVHEAQAEPEGLAASKTTREKEYERPFAVMRDAQRQSIQKVWPGLSEREADTATGALGNGGFTPSMAAKYKALDPAHKQAVDKWFSDSEDTAAHLGIERDLATNLERMDYFAQHGDAAQASSALVDLLRRADDYPASERGKIRERAMQSAAAIARENGISKRDIKAGIAAELHEIYGSDATEMADHYFGRLSGDEAPSLAASKAKTAAQKDAERIAKLRETRAGFAAETEAGKPKDWRDSKAEEVKSIIAGFEHDPKKAAHRYSPLVPAHLDEGSAPSEFIHALVDAGFRYEEARGGSHYVQAKGPDGDWHNIVRFADHPPGLGTDSGVMFIRKNSVGYPEDTAHAAAMRWREKAGAPPAAPEPHVLTKPEGRSVINAYHHLARVTGFPAVNIADLADQSGIPLDKLKQQILRSHKTGSVVLSTGDWSLSSDKVKSGVIEDKGQKMLQVRFLNDAGGMAAAKAIYRAGKSDETGIKPWSSWSPDESTAREYMDNPGFGGETLRKEQARFTNPLVADIRTRRGLGDLAEAIGMDREKGQEWMDNGWQYPWEESKKVRDAIDAAGYDAVQYVDDYPQGATTIVPTNNYRPQEDASLHASKAVAAAHAKVAQAMAPFRDEVKVSGTKRDIAQDFDATGNLANERGVQAQNHIRLPFDRAIPKGESRADRKAREAAVKQDLVAARPVVEAGGSKARLAAELAKVNASPAAKLRKTFTPIYQYALANFDRLNRMLAAHTKLANENYDALKAAGVDVGKRADYVHRVTTPPEDPNAPHIPFEMGSGNGSGNARGMLKGRSFDTMGDAIKAGYDPGAYGIHEADGRMVQNATRIIGDKAFLDKMKEVKAPTDGKPIIGQLVKRRLANGETELKVPDGYASVNAMGRPVVIHKQFAPLFSDLYGTSAIRNMAAGRALLKLAALGKHGTLVFDTFHVGRLLYKMAAGGGGSPITIRAGKPAFNYHAGLSLLEYSDADLDVAHRQGEITATEVKYARQHRAALDELVKAGLNVGKVSDNLIEQAKVKIPGLTAMNDWIFGKLSRGAMVQTALKFYERNLTRTGMSREQAARRTATEMNEYFGNLQNQGIFKSKTLQDVARLVFLAPNWTESQARYEGRAYGQLGASALDLARGKGLRAGNATRAMATGFVALLAANQVANYLSRGQSTFENEEDGHKLDAWVPGGKRGFWFNPFEIAGEYAHAAMKYTAQHENPVDVATHIASNKLSPLARGVKEAGTGRDAMGRHFLSDTDRFRSAAVDALPSPLPLGSVFEKDPRAPIGYRMTRAPGAMEKQVLQSAGAKVTAVQSPRTAMFALAMPFRADGGKTDSAGEYSEIRRALDNDQPDAVKTEMRWLLDRGKDLKTIAAALGVHAGGIAPERFTGGIDREKEMLKSLTPAQRALYSKAQDEHQANAKKFLAIARSPEGQQIVAEARKKAAAKKLVPAGG